MNVLFLHQNFPSQYQHVVRHLAGQPGNRVVFLTRDNDNRIPGVERVCYEPFRNAGSQTHHYLREAEAAVIAGQSVYEAALRLKRDGLTPDIMIGHNGWGETLYLKDVWPDVPLLSYFEFYYRATGVDVGFDPAFPTGPNDPPRVRTKNLINLLGAEAADWGQTPTRWQWSLYPDFVRQKTVVIHEGIDTAIARPDAGARLRLSDGPTLTPGDEVITFVARNLEPYRGFPVFMRALPEVLRLRPNAQVLIVGGDGVGYGAPPPPGKSFRQIMLEEVGDRLDLRRIHFLGKIAHGDFIKVLQISAAHVYLTYPFVLSWSMLEAMSAGCLVIGSATPPVQEVVRHGENGLLFDFFDIEALVETIVKALERRDEQYPLRSAARATVLSNYDLKTVILPKYLDIIDNIINRHFF
ncbi:glycosyltransferase family 4 protein [Azospirillum doebereinerae]|uniref:Glycosyltransferase n=1 Tax=Azospirillum doebereinerae TaxID=92933 RepID=A0A433JE93_9PROT|nr:glycosyltransferase family 4 protein [Azospirillum doebereinerae]RUQ75215.1 glycosyltransferase [Azospirillum doebereinerae]